MRGHEPMRYLSLSYGPRGSMHPGVVAVGLRGDEKLSCSLEYATDRLECLSAI